MPKQTDFIKLRGGRTLFHAIRVARSLNLAPNLFVTIRFWETSIPETRTSEAFSQLRLKFGKWIQRPSRRFAGISAPATFLWVIENPGDRGLIHAHWLVYVPLPRQQDFARKLDKWLASMGTVYTSQPVHIKPAAAGNGVLGTIPYMLKGQFESIARDHGIDPEPQGWVTGKRSGCSENLGPTAHGRLWRAGKHPRPQPWIQHKYPPRLQQAV